MPYWIRPSESARQHRACGNAAAVASSKLFCSNGIDHRPGSGHGSWQGAHLMKAIVFEQPGDPSVLKYVETPKPELAPGSALVKVHAAGINFADTFFIRGEYM